MSIYLAFPSLRNWVFYPNRHGKHFISLGSDGSQFTCVLLSKGHLDPLKLFIYPHRTSWLCRHCTLCNRYPICVIFRNILIFRKAWCVLYHFPDRWQAFCVISLDNQMAAESILLHIDNCILTVPTHTLPISLLCLKQHHSHSFYCLCLSNRAKWHLPSYTFLCSLFLPTHTHISLPYLHQQRCLGFSYFVVAF